MSSPSEEFWKREHEKPDQFTLAWWSDRFAEVLKGYRGASHAINRAIVECSDCTERMNAIEAKSVIDSEELREIKAKIGKVQADVVVLTERIDRMAEFLTKMKNGGKNP